MLKQILADPELAQAFGRKEVQEAIMDVTQNQGNWTKYADQPDVMAVFTKMTAMMQPPGGAAPPSPGGPPFPGAPPP